MESRALKASPTCHHQRSNLQKLDPSKKGPIASDPREVKEGERPKLKANAVDLFYQRPPYSPHFHVCAAHTCNCFSFLFSKLQHNADELSTINLQKWEMDLIYGLCLDKRVEECGSMYQLLTCNSFIYLPIIYIYITHPARQFDASAADSANGRWTVKLQRQPGILLFLSYHIDLFSFHLPCIRSRLIIVPAVPPQSPPTALALFSPAPPYHTQIRWRKGSWSDM